MADELKRKVHVVACSILGLDDEDHENDEEAEPLEKALFELGKMFNLALLDELEKESVEFVIDQFGGEAYHNPVEAVPISVFNNKRRELEK